MTFETWCVVQRGNVGTRLAAHYWRYMRRLLAYQAEIERDLRRERLWQMVVDPRYTDQVEAG